MQGDVTLMVNLGTLNGEAAFTNLEHTNNGAMWGNGTLGYELAFSKWGALTLLPGLLFSVFACTAEPKTYDECILQSMKGVKSDSGVRAIIKACRAAFLTTSKRNVNSRPLSYDEIVQVTGRATFETATHALRTTFSGRMYNGNATLTVSELTLEISTTIAGKKSAKLYRTRVTIEPHTTEYISIDTLVGDPGAEYSWAIVNAQGY